ncbi:uncharacterized protein G6M90_00g067190 [Metarhizium brunneum]|uniref:DUF7924 domain-containing protein n=1 Tax=Metarhizium brunneum TaxID=500148 RepID=A0A7D5V062_9HYPO
MTKTRAQRAARAAKQTYVLQEEGQNFPRRKRQRHTSPKSSQGPAIQGKDRKRTIDTTQGPAVQPTTKRPRGPTPSIDDRPDQAADSPIGFWVRQGHWPPDPMAGMEHALARKRCKRSYSASSTTPSDQRPREEKSVPYQDSRYETLLVTKGVFMHKSKLDVTGGSKTLCENLLENNQPVPENSLFDNDRFESTCQKIHSRNKARIIQDISRLIVPSAERLATMGAIHLKNLVETVNEGWDNSIPLTGTRPQPDYAVGFRRDAFTKDQLNKLSPFVGDFIAGDLSFFMATYYMYFPFLACEVNCGTAALDDGDLQNAHTMTLAARGIVELFRLVNREEELHRQILSFSISHDYCSVRLYGYYPVIDGKDTKYFRHLIHRFDFTALDGKEKWTAYRFTKNIYDLWMPEHFKKICSAIDQLPAEIDFSVSARSDTTINRPF